MLDDKDYLIQVLNDQRSGLFSEVTNLQIAARKTADEMKEKDAKIEELTAHVAELTSSTSSV